MHLLVFFLFVLGCWGDIRVTVDSKGGFNISVNNNLWLRSSRTALYADNKWYSCDDNSLPLTGITTDQGMDPNLGSWNETQLNYDLVRSGTHTKVVGRIRQWHEVSAITFHLDTGDQVLTNTVPLDAKTVRTVFPSFHIEKIDDQDQRGFFTFEGIMTGNGAKHAGLWNASHTVVRSGMESGPVVVFNTDKRGEGDILVISPFSRFMATSLSQANGTLEYGVMGSMESIPNNYNHSLIVFYSSKGINEGVLEWGQAMQKAHNRTTEYRHNDLSINYLGYYTDNGAYYYYYTEDNKTYEQTMLDSIQKISLPFRYLQIDSWWYYKGIGGGVSEWTARPDIFPDGLPALDRKLENIPIVAHNRYWSYDTVYKQNYSFVLNEKDGKALPVGNDSFWVDLFTQAREWNLIVYEQDWLITNSEGFTPLRTDIYLGHQWLTSMGAAAEKLNINLQYCMSLPRHILTSLEIPRVTHTRTSTDYAFHLAHVEEQWQMGISSMFAEAMGLASFKDVFWSTELEPGRSYGPNTKEVLPEREILIATLSTGPVGPGDAINYTNVERIMKCCRKDGLILKPDRPLTTINALISDWALYDSVSQGELYSTRTTINKQTFFVVFASAMKRDYTIYPSMIGSQSESAVIWSYNDSRIVTTFDNSIPLKVSADRCDNLTICVWYISPLQSLNDSTGVQYALLGEWNKWTAVSQQRFTSIVTDTQKHEATVTVAGVSGETVPVVVFHSVQLSVTVNCPISAVNGQARLIITTSNVVCS